MFKSGGLFINGVRIALDDASSELCFVSHAHSDHTEAFAKGKKILASEETFLLMGAQPSSASLPEGVSLANAGHMLGARQLVAQTEQGTFVYTGDFSLHSSFTTPGAEIIPCDVLMIDSTYCLPTYRFPKREEVIRQMRLFVQKEGTANIVFGAYVRGKAQELVKFLNEECGLAPIVSPAAARFCALYEKCGVKLDYLAAGTPEAEEEMRHPFVAIMPSRMVNFEFGAALAEAFGRETKTALATGWAAVLKFPVDAAFPFSDHADFHDTMRYIYESGAKKVICASSSQSQAAECLRAIGIDAVAKEETRPAQMTLMQC
ncbi:MAG: hypothetical protein N3G22_04715 [Candidatus Micrarchaeota archaeon]|nr:hypothetical protein [Candidatus Micrarchaeota archaeon]